MRILEIRKSLVAVGTLPITLCLGCFAAEPRGPAPRPDNASTDTARIAVAFPGLEPGQAQSSQENGILTLENHVISASWQAANGRLRPIELKNKLTGASYDQQDTEMFRLATRSMETRTKSIVVAVQLDTDKVVALASMDGACWTELATFPRTEFPGEPRLVRIGKMNLQAMPKDYPGDTGDIGEGAITELTPLPAQIPSGRFAFKAKANGAAAIAYPFPSGSKLISCRIDKGTDQGLPWGPALALIWNDERRFLLVGIRDKIPTFNVTTAAGEMIKHVRLGQYPALDLPASMFRTADEPKLVRLQTKPGGLRMAERVAGMGIDADFVSDTGIRAHWRAELRDGANYIRQTLDLAAPDTTVPLFGVELADLRVPEAKTIGTCPGCPVVAGNMFFGVELPGAQNLVAGTNVRIGFGCKLVLSPTQSCAFGAVTGVAPEGQLRRAFLCYIERERARPSKPFLHYNCWYDLGFSLNEQNILDVVDRFNEELVTKRGVPVLSYLADDGWDNPSQGLWVENTDKFPQGFRGLKAKMDKVGARLGIWISPLGGYGGAKQRTAQARRMGLIPETGELDLSDPRYKKWFQDRCLQLMREAGVNVFKWDRAGRGVSPHFMALLDVARNLRAANPDVFINVTVGTWPSPFWLNHVDTTWRMGSGDVGWAGKGDGREKWLTFRDGNCRKFFVEKSPLYPLNSVMHHGIVHGRCSEGARVGRSGANLKNEARSYFANGAMLQELYITPSMMTSDAWDCVAESAKWAHANADVLVDSHWAGGDPLKLETYGFAAWNPRKGTLMVRNPDDKPKTIILDAATAFELPPGAAKRYVLNSPYKDQRVQTLELESGKLRTVTLDPFEVLVFDANPK